MIEDDDFAPLPLGKVHALIALNAVSLMRENASKRRELVATVDRVRAVHPQHEAVANADEIIKDLTEVLRGLLAVWEPDNGPH